MKKYIKVLSSAWLFLLTIILFSACGKEEDNGYKETLKSYKGTLKSFIYQKSIPGGINNCTFNDVTLETRNLSVRITSSLEGKLAPSQLNAKIKILFTEIKYLDSDFLSFICSGHAKVYIDNDKIPYTLPFNEYIGITDEFGNLDISPSTLINGNITKDSISFTFRGEPNQ